MAKGKWHDRFNLFTGAVITGGMMGLEVSAEVVVAFTAGWLFSTLIFGPDTDITPKRRSQILRYFLYPYSFFFQHRGISHHFFWGTVTRNLYLLVLLIFFINIFVYLANLVGINLSVMDFLIQLKPHLKALFSSESLIFWKAFFSLFLGQWLSDLMHLFMDKLADKTGFFYK